MFSPQTTGGVGPPGFDTWKYCELHLDDDVTLAPMAALLMLIEAPFKMVPMRVVSVLGP